MSSIIDYFSRRQDSFRSRASVSTTTTVASYTVEDQFDPKNENAVNSTDSNENSIRKEAIYARLEGCQNVKVGDEVIHNHVHNNICNHKGKTSKKLRDNKLL